MSDVYECIRKFPVGSPAVRMELVGDDICPDCSGPLDTGKACMVCRAEWRPLLPIRYEKMKPPRD